MKLTDFEQLESKKVVNKYWKKEKDELTTFTKEDEERYKRYLEFKYFFLKKGMYPQNLPKKEKAEYLELAQVYREYFKEKKFLKLLKVKMVDAEVKGDKRTTTKIRHLFEEKKPDLDWIKRKTEVVYKKGQVPPPAKEEQQQEFTLLERAEGIACYCIAGILLKIF